MIKKIGIFVALLLCIGLFILWFNQPQRKWIPDEDPPLPTIKVGSQNLSVYRATYTWSSKHGGKTSDYPAPAEIVKDKTPDAVNTGDTVTVIFPSGKAPAEMSWEDKNGPIKESRLSVKKGIHWYELHAKWPNQQGDAWYVIYIDGK